MSKPRINIIAAVASNNVIGRNGELPWHLPQDLLRFRQLTIGHHVIIGRKTFESLKRPLPGRFNIVISRQDYKAPEGVKVVESMEEALYISERDNEVFIIGGAEIYKLALPFADRLLLTEVEGDFQGDTYFPYLDIENWERYHEAYGCDAKSGVEYNFVNYVRKKEMEGIEMKGPYITSDDIEAQIVKEDYYVFPGTTMTVCCLTLKNGFNVIGESACISPLNFNAEIGKQLARIKARNEIWKLEGYAMHTKLKAMEEEAAIQY